MLKKFIILFLISLVVIPSFCLAISVEIKNENLDKASGFWNDKVVPILGKISDCLDKYIVQNIKKGLEYFPSVRDELLREIQDLKNEINSLWKKE